MGQGLVGFGDETKEKNQVWVAMNSVLNNNRK